MRDEQQLVEAARKNPRRFGLLYERYYEQMFLFVYKRVGDQEMSADLTSQLFLKAMTHLPKYQFRGVPFSAWLYRIAINEVNQYFRQSKKQRHVSLDSAGLQLMMEEAEVRHDEHEIQSLVQVLDRLEPEEVQLIELRFFEKQSFKEIGIIFNITENNAKVRTYRLLTKMKKYILQLYEEK